MNMISKLKINKANGHDDVTYAYLLKNLCKYNCPSIKCYFKLMHSIWLFSE